jgi:hypothetical protein
VTQPAPWSADELARRALLEQRVAVAVNLRRHDNLIAWARERALLVRMDRATPWGNPFELGKNGDRETVIANDRNHYLPFKPSLLARLGNRRARDVGPDAPRRSALEPPAAPLWERHRPIRGGVAHGFQVGGQPTPGEMVVYGSSYGVFGHIATVVAIEPGRYEVIEQNLIDFNPNLEPHWQTFDLRSIAWPDASVVGFVVGPSSR